jgi:methylenetetrahydrofolate reductase (NADPH)
VQVKDIIASTKDAGFSFEIVPPARGRSIQQFIEIVETLMPLEPKWIDVTAHAASMSYAEAGDGSLRRRTLKKRPGTLGICGVIQNRFQVDTVAHLLCLGFTREETEDALIELSYLGAENVFAIRGDDLNYEKSTPQGKSVNNYAVDLVSQIVDVRQGRFLDETTEPFSYNFCVGVAGYPEKHFQAPNFETDLMYLKKKVEAGADYIVTQMFFDNQVFFRFVDSCRAAGIHVPIVPGLKVIKSAQQMRSIPSSFHVNLPNELVTEVMANPQHVPEIGKRWARRQCEELLSRGHKNLHFYVMNDAQLVHQTIREMGYL